MVQILGFEDAIASYKHRCYRSEQNATLAFARDFNQTIERPGLEADSADYSKASCASFRIHQVSPHINTDILSL